MSNATTMAPGLDMPITLKVNHDGTVQKFKLPLHDMVYPVLEQKLRAALAIPSDAQVLFERYSDSASVYVKLDRENPSIYKQLYRAAKAKSKLKLRAKTIEPKHKQPPKPATVEDDIEGATQEIVADVKKFAIHPKIPEEQQNKTTKSDTTEHSDLRKDFEARLAKLMEVGCYPSPTAGDRGVENRPANVCVGTRINPFTPPFTSRVTPNIAVSCNNCEKVVPNSEAHYHCSTCDDGDFDLCETCVSGGTTCYSPDHWLIKRTMVNGQMVNSFTETLAPKPKKKAPETQVARTASVSIVKTQTGLAFSAPALQQGPNCAATVPATQSTTCNTTTQPRRRICNSCVQDFLEYDCLHCSNCEDYDLCKPCFAKEIHGHHPLHVFVPAMPGVLMPASISLKMRAGRNQAHHAICDGCDAFIYGVRHKCLDCPDWDYCSECVQNAHMIHPRHRFAPLAEPIADLQSVGVQPMHVGICCDGPLCSAGHSWPSYIRGVRYKCAVCDDLDFCANCQANPANEHNKTHPLIMFKTPVRNVHVTTTGENEGKQMPAMGDRAHGVPRSSPPPSLPKPSAAPESEPGTLPTLAKAVDVEVKAKDEPKEKDLRAVFIKESVQDGTILPPNHVFQQTWVLRNEGQVAWPAGCLVKYTGGEDMVHVESASSSGSPGPVSTSELNAASESTKCAVSLAPGEEFSFTVVLRTPSRAGRAMSHWRLSTAEGMKFGHHLWCDVNVRAVKPDVPKTIPIEIKEEVEKKPKVQQPNGTESQMVFPKLDKESPMSSIHEAAQSGTDQSVEDDDFEDCAEQEWDESDDGFMTDEEYDVLDASDEEFLEEQQRKLQK